jgi:hypothetical protein
MEMSCQLHAPAFFPHEDQARYPLVKKLNGSAPVWTLLILKNPLPLSEIEFRQSKENFLTLSRIESQSLN